MAVSADQHILARGCYTQENMQAADSDMEKTTELLPADELLLALV